MTKTQASSLRILHVIETSGGGSGRHVIDLAEGLVERNYNVTVVYSLLRAEAYFIKSLARIEGLAVETLHMRRAVGLQDILDSHRLSKLIRQLGPFDILHGHSSKAGALVRLLPRSIKGARIYTPHAFRTMDQTLGRVSRMFYGRVERALALRCNAIIVGSDQEADIAASMGIDSTKVRQVAFGIDAPALPTRLEARKILGLAETDIIIGFVGRFVHQKAPERIINALAELSNQRVKLVLIGEGEHETKLRRQTQQLNITDRVVFAGVRDGLTSMPAFDVLAVPSRYESLGYVLLEAVVAGLPIVSSPVGVAEDVVEIGRNGVIVPNVDDPMPWKNAFDSILSPSELEKAVRFAQERRYSKGVKQMVDETLNVYREALGAERAKFS